MPLPDSGQPISFEDINLELGNSANAELDLQSASELFGESDAPYGMDELAGLSFNTFTYGMAGVSGFAVSDDGTVTAPTNTLGTINSRVYSSGYNSGTNKFPTVSTDTTRTVDVQVEAPSTGYSNNSEIVSGSESAVQGALETYTISTWVASGGAISINGQDGVVSLSNSGNSTTTPTFTPTSFSTFTTPASEEQNVSIGNITVPSNYFNTGQTVSGTIQVTQLAFVAPAFTLSDWTGTISIDGQDGTISATVGNVSSVNIDTSTFSTVSTSTSRTVQFDLIGIPSGYSNTGGDLNNQTQTVTQAAYVNPPSLSITTSPTDWLYDETGVKTLTVTNTGGDLETVAQFSLTGLGLFKLVGVDSNVPVINPYTNYYQATATDDSVSTFSVGVQPEGNNTNSSDNTATVSFLGSNDGGSQTVTFTPTQGYQATWSTDVSSLSFIANGTTQDVVLSTSEDWTATLSNSHFSINTSSGTSGTHTITVTAPSTDLGETGTLTFSTSGQSDIVVSLTQDAQPLEFDWFSGGANRSGTSISLTPNASPSISYSFGLYAFRGSTPVQTNWSLDRTTGSSWITVNTTTSGGSSSVSTTTTQNTNGTPYLYVNVSENTSIARAGTVELSDSGNNIVITISISQSASSVSPPPPPGPPPPPPGDPIE